MASPGLQGEKALVGINLNQNMPVTLSVSNAQKSADLVFHSLLALAGFKQFKLMHIHFRH